MSLYPVYSVFDITPVSANDVWVTDDEGSKYLDLYGGHAVISIGHSHPYFLGQLKEQLDRMAFYSNSVNNPIQEELSRALPHASGCTGYQLFMCNSGAEANENALKLASFHNGRKGIITFNNAFHGRTSAAVAATDNAAIQSPMNAQHQVERFEFGDLSGVRSAIESGDHCAVIIECIQGVGGLDEPTTEFLQQLESLCDENGLLLIADEVQSGFGRTGDFFAFQKHGIQPHLITMAKGMGNGIPVGGVLIHPDIVGSRGQLGTTFGGNHLSCVAVLAVLKVLEDQNLLACASDLSAYFREQAMSIGQIKAVKGRGLMLGLEFDFRVAELRKTLLTDHKIFTGSSKDPNVLRILPPLTAREEHLDMFFNALKKVL